MPFFRKLGIRCIYYIDDSLNMEQDFDKCKDNTNIMVQKLDDLGYRINRKKFVLIPTKRIVFFGLIIDTEVFKVFLTDEKVDKIISLGHSILQQKNVVIRCLAPFIGLIVHAFYAVTFGPLHYRNLERNKVCALRNSFGNFESIVFINDDSKNEINWWISNLKSANGKFIRQKSIDCWIETDASLEGWGSKFNEQFAGGRWSKDESSHHINFLELLAIFLSLKTFFTHKKSLHIGIRSDNTTAVAYVNEMGGMTSILLDNLSAEIWSWCSERDMFLTAQYIPGNENFNADHMSRNFTDLTEWKLKSEIFHRICNHFFLPDIDLFASRLNCQLPKYVSWSFDPHAIFTGAFTISWSEFKPYIFPPFSLIGKVMLKIMSDKVEKAILIVPFWPAQNWFSLLNSNLISLPVRLPRHTDLLIMPHSGEVHPLRKKLNLIVCVVSGRRYLTVEFQHSLPVLSCHHGIMAISHKQTISVCLEKICILVPSTED